MVAAALALMLAMTWGGVRYPWASWPILALIAGSAALWGLFAWRIATAAEPFIPPAVLSERTVAGIVISGFFSIGAIVGLSIYMPLYLELALGASASMSGLALIAFMVGTVLGAFAAGRGLGRHQALQAIPTAGLLLAIAALAAMAHPARVACRGRRPAVPRRRRHRHHVSGDDGADPECGGAASVRRRHRHLELLPPARRHHRGRGLRRHRARQRRCVPAG